MKSRQSSSQSSIFLKFVTQILSPIEKTFGERLFGQRNFFSQVSDDYFWMIISIFLAPHEFVEIVRIEPALVGNEEKRNFTTAKHPLLELLAAKKEKTRRQTWYTRREAEELFCSPSKRRVMPGELAE